MRQPSRHEDLVTGIPTIDDQHFEIARHTDELLIAIASDKPHSELEKLLNGLIEITARHFATEEGLMLASGYSDFEEHRKEHRRLLDQLELVRGSLAGGQLLAQETTARFIQTLSEQHVILSDQPLARILIARGFSS